MWKSCGDTTRRRWAWAGLAILAVAVLVSGFLSSSLGPTLLAPATTPALEAGLDRPEQRVAFVSERDGMTGMSIAGSGGSGPLRLTDDSGNDFYPKWSPDGEWITFQSTRNGNTDVYVMDPDGSGQTRLTYHRAEDYAPSWSYDGRIAFHSLRDGNREIYVMNADGSGKTRLTYGRFVDSSPSWSPDGRIAFHSERDGNAEIYVMNDDGSGQTRLTENPALDCCPSWSSDGRIAFHSLRNGNSDIYVINDDGSGLTRLTYDEAEDYSTSWFPASPTPERSFGSDSRGVVQVGPPSFDELRRRLTVLVRALHVPRSIKRIRFRLDTDRRVEAETVGARDGGLLEGWELYGPDSAGWYEAASTAPIRAGSSGALFKLTLFDVDDASLRVPVELDNSRYPDGIELSDPVYVQRGSTYRVAFVSERDGTPEIYTMGAGAAGPVRITNNTTGEYGASWSPDGRRIAFHSDRAGGWDIYVMEVDGSRLTYDETGDYPPSWSMATASPEWLFDTDRGGVVQVGPASFDRMSGRLTALVRAWYVPKDVNRIRFRVDTDRSIAVKTVAARDGGLLESWDLYGPNLEGWYEALSTAPLEPGSSGALFQLTLFNVDDENLRASVEFDNSIYLSGAQLSGRLYIRTGPERRVGFVSERDGTPEIYVMELDGSEPVRLTENEEAEYGASWSPDGGRIAFHSDRDGGWDIYVMDADGLGVVRLTDRSGNDFYPKWSPSGERVAFQSTRNGNTDVYVMDADGSRLTRLTYDAGGDMAPSWSYDGRIAFHSTRAGNREIYVMDGDGSDMTRLTYNRFEDYGPRWSRDGRIAFHSERGGNRDVYVMRSDGSGETRLTEHPARDCCASWSSDGRILFESDRSGNWDVYVMDADGSGMTRLTHSEAADYSSSWVRD